MKFSFIFILIILAGCAGKTDNSILTDTLKMSQAQAFLSNLKDSMVFQYNSVESYKEKQEILDTFVRQLQSYLKKTPLDSIRVTMDEVIVEGFTVKTTSHFNRIEFSSKITFKNGMPPRPDSIYKFMKNLKPGSTVLVNFGYTGDFEINSPDSPMLSTFKIDAFPVPIQYKSK